MKQFIKVQDEEVAKKLSLLGFQLLSQNCGIYTFLNQPQKNLNFEETEKKKIVYTDILNI